jgi:hypothetical protein
MAQAVDAAVPIRERYLSKIEGGMVRTAFAAGFFALALGAVPLAAEPGPAQTATVHSTDFSAQIRRPPPRVRVYPGRLLYRDCDFRLVQQWRPGGPVIIPWQRCWWVRG